MASRRALWILFAALPAAPQQPTVLDGVFTAAQADRGEAVYATRCARCHDGADVDGPPLTGTPFIDRWREDRLTGLHDFIHDNMPQDAPGTLKAGEYMDVVAYMLKANAYTPGTAELTAETMAATLLVGKEGPKPLPTNALVEATGCLAKAGSNWTLTSVPTLRRTRNAELVTANERTGAAARASGTQTFQLRNLDDAVTKEGKAGLDGFTGGRLLVKGVLVRSQAGDRVNVLAWEPVAKECQP